MFSTRLLSGQEEKKKKKKALLLFESVYSNSWIRSSHPKEYFQLNGNNLSNASNSLQESTLIDGHFSSAGAFYGSLYRAS